MLHYSSTAFSIHKGESSIYSKPEGNHSRDPLFLQCEYVKRRIAKDNKERQYRTFVPTGPFLSFFRLLVGRDCRAAQCTTTRGARVVSNCLKMGICFQLKAASRFYVFLIRFHR